MRCECACTSGKFAGCDGTIVLGTATGGFVGINVADNGCKSTSLEVDALDTGAIVGSGGWAGIVGGDATSEGASPVDANIVNSLANGVLKSFCWALSGGRVTNSIQSARVCICARSFIVLTYSGNAGVIGTAIVVIAVHWDVIAGASGSVTHVYCAWVSVIAGLGGEQTTSGVVAGRNFAKVGGAWTNGH